MATTFTTWAALETQLLNDIASSSWTVSYMQKGSHQVTYRNLEEAQKALAWVRQMKAVDGETTAAAGFVGRTYAKRGRL